MVRKLFFVFFILTLFCFSQEKKISLEKFKTIDKTFKGTIDHKYDVTLYLKLEHFSEDHLYSYSVKGWYYYNKIKKKIPLVGVFNPMNGLTLINTLDKNFEKNVLAFNYSGVIWDQLNKIETFKNFEEKIFISNQSIENNTWSNQTKTLKININNNLDELHVFENFQFLKIGTSTINLSDYQINYEDLKIISKKNSPNETRILLEYKQLGNLNIQGRCGGAIDFGYIILAFNDKNELLQIEEIELDNCRGFIYSEQLKNDNKKILKFKTTDTSDNKEQSKIIMIDTQSISIVK